VCLVPNLVGSGGKADCAARADRVIFCEAGMQEELFIVDGLPACRRSCTMERGKSKCSTVRSVFAGRSQKIMRLLTRANEASLRKCQLMNCMETRGRSGGSPESKSCQGRLLVVIHPWEGKLHPSFSTSQEELL